MLRLSDPARLRGSGESGSTGSLMVRGAVASALSQAIDFTSL